MLRSASDDGVEELIQCIETFQQLSLESPAEPPQVFLHPQRLPWDEKLETNGEDVASRVLSSIQNVDKESQVPSKVDGEQRLEHHHDDQTSAIDSKQQQTLVTSGQPHDSTASIPQSSASTYVPASLADFGHIDDTTTATILPELGTDMPHESSNPGQGGATSQGVLSLDGDDDELNQFDDDTSSDGSESLQVLHVDDPRLAFGQSVYVDRRDKEHVTYSQSQLSLGRTVVSCEGPTSELGRRSSNVAGSVHTVTAQSSTSGGLQVSPSDSLSRPPPLALPAASSDGSMLPLLTASMGTLSGPPPVSVPLETPTSSLGVRQPPQRPYKMPSVAQSVPASMPFGSTHAPVSSLGVSASMPPLRATAVDEERADEPGVGLSEVRSYSCSM